MDEGNVIHRKLKNFLCFEINLTEWQQITLWYRCVKEIGVREDTLFPVPSINECISDVLESFSIAFFLNREPQEIMWPVLGVAFDVNF